MGGHRRVGRITSTVVVVFVSQPIPRTFGAGDEVLVERTFAIDKIAPTERDGKQLEKFITAAVFPHSWEAAGGTGTLNCGRKELVVSNTEAACDQIAALVEKLGKLPTLGDKDVGKTPDTARYEVGSRKVGKREIQTMLYPIMDLIRTIGNQPPGADGMMELITTMLARRSWEDGGSLAIFPPRGALLVSNVKDVQEQLASLLSALRKVPTGRDALRKPPAAAELPIGTFKVGRKEHLLVIYPVADLVVVGPRPENSDFEGLKELIESGISPKSWDAAGGSGAMREFHRGYVLAVANEKDVHARIASLLAALRKVPRFTRPAAKARPQAPTVVGTEKRGDEELQMVVYDVGGRILLPGGLADFESLREKIVEVEPSNWDHAGGHGWSREFENRGVLVVVNTEKVQAAVAKVIDRYRPARRR